LWYDEALIALNVIHNNYAGLTGKLDWLQAAPIGVVLDREDVYRALRNQRDESATA
jgi:hypothetical protein